MVEARIFQRAKSSMQSGQAGAARWMVEYEPTEAKRPDPLTGWAGSGDVRGQIRLTFSTLEAARAYCAREGLPCHVVPGQERSLKLQAYSDNFRGVDIV